MLNKSVVKHSKKGNKKISKSSISDEIHQPQFESLDLGSLGFLSQLVVMGTFKLDSR
jgi:hypothetical protein